MGQKWGRSGSEVVQKWLRRAKVGQRGQKWKRGQKWGRKGAEETKKSAKTCSDAKILYGK